MKIGIDYQTASGSGGNSRYTHDLVQHSIGTDDEIYLYDFLHNFHKQNILKGKNIHHRSVYLTPPYAPHNIREFNEQITKFISRIDKLDIFHFTNPLNAVLGSYKMIVTVHDLCTFVDRSFAKKVSHTILQKKLPIILNESKAIIAVSQYTKRDLVENFDIDANKVIVIYEVASDEFYPEINTDIGTKIGASRFILYAGQLQPRKNIIRLIEAFSNVHTRHPDVSLMLAGSLRDEVYKDKLQEVITRYHLEDSIIFTGRIEDSVLRKLYSSTECFVFPSLFEGFGLPPLEAMQCGAPVIASNTSSLPEVVGDAGILIDPMQSEEISSALEKVLSDETLRSRMCTNSLIQASKFNWKRTGHDIHAMYDNVALL